MGLQDTTSVHICSKNSNIKNAHGKDQGLKNHGGRNHAPKSACQALKLENKDFWLTKYSSPTSTLNTSRETLAVWIS
jgi:hypothetical protein